MGRKFFQRYSRKYFRHRTGNRSYWLVGEISSLLGKLDIFHNLSGKRSKKVNKFPLFMGKLFVWKLKKGHFQQHLSEKFVSLSNSNVIYPRPFISSLSFPKFFKQNFNIKVVRSRKLDLRQKQIILLSRIAILLSKG